MTPPDPPRQITLDQWQERYAALWQSGGAQCERPSYVGCLSRHVEDGDTRLLSLKFDNSPAALRLWNLILTEEERLHEWRGKGKKIVGTMKDLGTVPVMAFSLPNVIAFYPDGAWWTPCIMEQSNGLLAEAERLGIDETFCPVRAMLGAFVLADRFPIPDLLTCSTGAVCDDFRAIAQRLEGLGHPILWWEVPPRRSPGPGEPWLALPGGFKAPASQVALVRQELLRVKSALEALSGTPLDEPTLSRGIWQANRVRQRLAELRSLVFGAPLCPLPALEMLLAEMLAIHFCSDVEETLGVLDDLLAEVHSRIEAGQGFLAPDAVRVAWVNPVADLRAMNLVEQCGGRICATDYMFAHALDELPEELEPMDALARSALADPMVGPASQRAQRILADVRRYGCEALIVSRIPGASHCAFEGEILRELVGQQADIPTLELEIPSLCDAMLPALRTRIEALMETAKGQRMKDEG